MKKFSLFSLHPLRRISQGLLFAAAAVGAGLVTNDAHAQIVSSSNETLVPTTIAGPQYNFFWSVRTVAVQPDGSSIVVWIDDNGLDGQSYGIYGQRFDANGAKIGTQFQVNTTTAGGQDSPTIAVAPDGSFIVAWYGPASGLDVFAQRFSKTGDPIGGEFLLNTNVSGNQKYPELAFFPDGTFVGGFVDAAETVLQRFDATGRTIGQETRISASGVDAIIDSMVVRPDNTVVVAWTAGGDVYAQRFSATLAAIGIPQMLNQNTTGTQEYAVVGVDGENNTVFTWQSDGQDGSGMGAYFRRFDANLTPLSNELAVTTNTTGAQTEPQVAVDASGRFLVVWSDDNNRDGGGTAGGDSGTSIWMRSFDVNGNPVGVETMVNQSITGAQFYPTIGGNNSGRIVISWQGNGTQAGQVDAQGVFARSFQYTQTGTTTLSVSPATATAGDLVTVTMTLTAPSTTLDVDPNPLGVFGTQGVFASYVSGPTPVSATVGTAPVSFVWTYRVTATSEAGELFFGGNAHSDGGAIFPYADSAATTIKVTPGLYLSDLTAPNLVGDSNVSSQPDQGPRVFTIGAKITNPSLNTLTDVVVYLGDGTTPGIFPDTTMALAQTGSTYQGTFDLDPLAGAGDCTRPLITLGAARRVIAGGIDFDGNGIVNSLDNGVLSNGKTVVGGRVDVNLSGTVTIADDLPRPPGVFYGYREPAIIDGYADINGDGAISALDTGTYGGETRNLYWQVSYDVLDAFGKPTWGDAQDIGDDLRYYWDVWGSALENGIVRQANYTEFVKVRNEISAAANKITPNPNGYISGGPPRILAGGVDVNSSRAITTADDGFYFGKPIIDGKVDMNNSGSITTADDGVLNGFPVIDGSVDVNRDGSISAADDGILVQTGQTFTITVNNATFGTVGQGYDENRDSLWDYDFWHQPVGEMDWPSGAFRLVDVQSDVIGTGGSNPLNGITTHYDNEPYLSRLFDDRLNQGGGFDATYSYTFLALSPGAGFITPYQEAASGANNEKYNGDYGAGVQILTGLPGLLINKTGSPDPTLVGGTTTWTMTYQNVSSTPAGEPGSGNGVVVEDGIPANTTFVAGSATSSTYPATVYYSTDNGITWSSIQPVSASSVTRLRWHIEQALPAGASGIVGFLTTVNSGTPNFTQITNTAEIKLGTGPILGTATAQVYVGASVPSSITGTVRKDTDNNNTGDAAFAGVTVSIFTDPNGDGDPSDGVLFTQNPADPDGTVITGADGSYTFSNLLPGSYVVVETDPSGYQSVSDGDGTTDSPTNPTDAVNTNTNDNRISVNLSLGETDSGNDFVDEQLGVVTGHLYVDTNGNGNQDVGEPNLANVDVLITDSNSVTQTVTTNASGDWTATVPPGSTSANIIESDPQYPTGYSQTQGTDPTTTVAVAGVSTNGGIDGFYLPATLTGQLYIDTNGNGTQDSGEPNLANVDVLITDVLNNTQTVTTNSLGVWTATVPPGSTSANIFESDPQYPTGYSQTQGADPTTTVAVAGVSTNGGIDGFYLPASISGYVRIDTDGNTTGDNPQGIVTVTLHDGSNNVIATTTTGVDGSYSFPNVTPGSYKIVQTVPNGFVAVADVDGADFTTIGDATFVTVVAGNSLTGQDFVNSQFASIAGNVFNDLDRLTDNTVDGTGTNAGGIFINLVNPTGDLVIASIPVNANGTYSFSQANGVNINSNYLLVLTPLVQTVGNVLTTSSLPTPWLSVGENLGAGIGSDGTANGKLAVSTTVGALVQANFGIVQVTDVTPVITAQPNVMNGPTDFNIRVQVVELNQISTEGTIVVRIPKDTRWTLREAYDTNLLTLDGVPMENNKWTYSQNATQHIFTTVNPFIVIPNGGFSYFGIKARWSTVAQEGIYTITTQIDSGSGNENRIDNNSDAEKIDFFDK